MTTALIVLGVLSVAGAMAWLMYVAVEAYQELECRDAQIDRLERRIAVLEMELEAERGEATP